MLVCILAFLYNCGIVMGGALMKFRETTFKPGHPFRVHFRKNSQFPMIVVTSHGEYLVPLSSITSLPDYLNNSRPTAGKKPSGRLGGKALVYHAVVSRGKTGRILLGENNPVTFGPLVAELSTEQATILVGHLVTEDPLAFNSK